MTATDPAELAPPSERPGARPNFSVVIPNHNYGAYLGDAVSSALKIDWPDVEVLVVDDGSTDESLGVLEQFGDQITVLTQPNMGPRVACNRGFARSRGDIVIFLDSDDLVDPSIAREVAAVWGPGISKVQIEMRRIDRDGQVLPNVIPRYRGQPTPEQLRRWLLTTSAYPTPPGSGNAYTRGFLEQLFPLDDSCGDATDSACLAAAPLLGDVVTIPKPLASYRVHGANRSSLRADSSRLPNQILRALQRHLFALKVAGLPSPKTVPPALFRSRHLLQMRVAQQRLSGDQPPLAGDSRRRMFRDTAASPWAPGPEGIGHRLAVAAWCLTTLAAPSPMARWLISKRFQ